MTKRQGMGICVMCDKRLSLANTRHQRHFVEPDPEGFSHCDGCQEVLATELGQVVCVYDWRQGGYHEWKVIQAPEYDKGTGSWHIGIEKHEHDLGCAPRRHYAWWTGTRWEEGCI